MEVSVTLTLDHKNLGRLQQIIDASAGFARPIVETVSDDAVVETNKPDTAAVVSPPVEKPKKEEPKKEKPVVEKPETSPDEVRAALLAYSKQYGTEKAIEVLKSVGKAEKVKDVEPENYAALIEVLSQEPPF